MARRKDEKCQIWVPFSKVIESFALFKWITKEVPLPSGGKLVIEGWKIVLDDDEFIQWAIDAVEEYKKSPAFLQD